MLAEFERASKLQLDRYQIAPVLQIFFFHTSLEKIVILYAFWFRIVRK